MATGTSIAQRGGRGQQQQRGQEKTPAISASFGHGGKLVLASERQDVPTLVVLARMVDVLDCAVRLCQARCGRIGNPSYKEADGMRQEVRYQLWIAAAAGVIFFTNLGGPALFDMDEALYSTCAREMLATRRSDRALVQRRDVPREAAADVLDHDGRLRDFRHGKGEWGARFFSAVMGVGTALAAFHLGRILFNARVGLWAGLITASTIIFTISARAATVDSALTFVTTLAFLLFAMGWKKSQWSGCQLSVVTPRSHPTLKLALMPSRCTPDRPGGVGERAGGHVAAAGGDGGVSAGDRRLAEAVSVGLVDAALHGAAGDGGRRRAVVRVGGH